MTGVVVGLFAVGVAAVIAEFFLPTFGIVGVIGGGCVAAAVVVAYRSIGNTAGSITLLSALVAAPLLVVLFFKLFPRTFVGRRLILASREEARNGFVSHTESRYRDLTGCSGVVVTALRPAGTVEIEGQRRDAISGGEYLDVGTRVIVVRVEGSRIRVRGDAARRLT